MNLPDNLKYAETHEWVRVESDGTLTVGISEHAQESIDDIVSFELPEAGQGNLARRGGRDCRVGQGGIRDSCAGVGAGCRIQCGGD